MQESPEWASPAKGQSVPPEEEEEAEGEGERFDPESPNQKFFDLSQVKPLDLKAHWLGNTQEVIQRFDQKMQQLKQQKQIMREGFSEFARNQHRFRVSSLRKIVFEFDKKALYLEFMRKSRRTVQKLHPSLILNICSYVEDNVFLALAKLRRVSQVFNFIFRNEQVVSLFAEKDFGVPDVSLSQQQQWGKEFTAFCQTLLYYKAINYTAAIPHNSIKEDLQRAVAFIHDVHKRVYQVKSLQIGYFQLLNKFMRRHRVVIALESLSFADLAVTRLSSMTAFSNYLALNPGSRQKEEITKTKYLKMIELLEGEDGRDALVVNSRISNFLAEQYQYQFAVFIDTLHSPPPDLGRQLVFDLVIFHYHNPLGSFFARGIVLEEGRIEVNAMTLDFGEDLRTCRMGYRLGEHWEDELMSSRYMPSVGANGHFGDSYVYRGEFYYVILVKVDPPTPEEEF